MSPAVGTMPQAVLNVHKVTALHGAMAIVFGLMINVSNLMYLQLLPPVSFVTKERLLG